MTPYNEILTLHLRGYNNSAIAQMTGSARGTVIDVLKRAEQYDLVFPQENGLTDVEIHRILHPPIKRQNEYMAPEMGTVIFAANLPGNSIAKEWKRYAALCDAENRKAYSKSAFQGFIRDLDGKYTLPEYSDKLRITILKNIEISGCNTSVLFAEIGYSECCFAQILTDLKPRTWINQCRQLIKHIGCVPTTLSYIGHLPKPLEAETISFAKYYGLSFETEKIKGFGQWFVDQCENTDDSHTSANVQIARICQHHNGMSLFSFSTFDHVAALRLQRSNMHPIPAADYETREIKHPTVQMNFHVHLEGKYYSVPFELRHERFTAEITDNLVELYLDDVLICVHDRLTSDSQKYSTMPEHMPASDDMIPWGETSGRSLRAWAKRIGFATFQVTDLLLKRSAFEPQSYNTCTALLMNASQFGDKMLNSACKAALSDKTERLNLKWISNYIKEQTSRKEE